MLISNFLFYSVNKKVKNQTSKQLSWRRRQKNNKVYIVSLLTQASHFNGWILDKARKWRVFLKVFHEMEMEGGLGVALGVVDLSLFVK